MQAEFLAQAGDGLAVGGFQFNPDEAVGFPYMVADVVECDRLGLVCGKKQAVDDGLQLRTECAAILVHAQSPSTGWMPASAPDSGAEIAGIQFALDDSA